MARTLLCMLAHSNPFFTWAINLRAWAVNWAYNIWDGAFMDFMWNDFNKLSFCGPNLMDFQAFFSSSLMLLRLAMNASLFSIIPHLIFHFEHGWFTLVETNESIKIGQALNSLSFGWKCVNSKYQTLKILQLELQCKRPNLRAWTTSLVVNTFLLHLTSCYLWKNIFRMMFQPNLDQYIGSRKVWSSGIWNQIGSLVWPFE